MDNELPPLCANPGCTNRVHQKSHGYGYTTYCSVACRNQHTAIKRVQDGTHHFLHQNLVLDDEGKSIMAVKATKTKLDNGTHNFLSDNREKDEFGRDIINLKQKQTMLDLYGTKSTSLGYLRDNDGNIIDCEENKNKFYELSIRSSNNQMKIIKEGKSIWVYQRDDDGNILDNEHNKLVYEYHKNHAIYNGWLDSKYNSESGILSSYIEDELYSLLIKNHNVIRQYKVLPYFVDFYLSDLNLFVECDGMYKWIFDGEKYNLNDYYLNRKNYIISNTNIDMINIPTIFINSYKNDPNSLELVLKNKSIY